jgi:hypothetical protein
MVRRSRGVVRLELEEIVQKRDEQALPLLVPEDALEDEVRLGIGEDGDHEKVLRPTAAWRKLRGERSGSTEHGSPAGRQAIRGRPAERGEVEAHRRLHRHVSPQRPLVR